jgi:hypothetical protein
MLEKQDVDQWLRQLPVKSRYTIDEVARGVAHIVGISHQAAYRRILRRTEKGAIESFKLPLDRTNWLSRSTVEKIMRGEIE